MISIIIPVYNQAAKIIKLLNSLILQTEQDLEVIIVNDGSTDNLGGVLENYFKNNTLSFNVLILQQENRGAPSARNAGWKKSHGEYLFFCDADAVLIPEALAIMKQTLIANPGIAFAYSAFYFGHKLFKLWPYSLEKLKQMPYIHTMALIRTITFPVGGWDESLKKFQDWDLFLTIAEAGYEGVYISKPLFSVSSGGVISSWLPKSFYRFLPFLKTVKKYHQAMAIIKAKHRL